MTAETSERSNGRAGNNGDEEQEENTNGWLTTYADMVTLLLTFFVLLVAMSSQDTANAEMFMLALSRDGITAEQFWEIRDKYDFEARDYDAWDEAFPYTAQDEDEAFAETSEIGMAALNKLHDEMAAYIESEDLGDVISLTFNGDSLLMTLANDILFETGQVSITAEMIESVDVIAELLAATYEPDDPFEIVIAGHTDNIPINTVRYPSNWHISRDRSMNFLWELLSKSQLDPGLFYARACGEYHPIATNDTPEGRRINRRVEVMVSLTGNS